MAVPSPDQVTRSFTHTVQTDERWPIFLSVIRNMMTRKLQRNVEQVLAYNIEQTKELARDHGVIIAPNHVAYWDSCLYFLLSGFLSTRSFVFVAQKTLQRLPFLRWCGALPLNTTSKEHSLLQLLHTTHLNNQPTQFWIFPQGEHRPTDRVPLKCKRGILLLAKHLKLPIVPTAIQYLYKDDESPIAYVSFQPPLPYDSTIEEIELSIQQGLDDSTKHHVGLGSKEFTPLFPSASPKTDDLATRILAWISGRFLKPLT